MDSNSDGADEQALSAEALIQRVLDQLTPEQVDELVDYEGTYQLVAEGAMAWGALFLSGLGRIGRRKPVREMVASAVLILAVFVRTSYALGVIEGTHGSESGNPT